MDFSISWSNSTVLSLRTNAFPPGWAVLPERKGMHAIDLGSVVGEPSVAPLAAAAAIGNTAFEQTRSIEEASLF